MAELAMGYGYSPWKKRLGKAMEHALLYGAGTFKIQLTNTEETTDMKIYSDNAAVASLQRAYESYRDKAVQQKLAFDNAINVRDQWEQHVAQRASYLDEIKAKLNDVKSALASLGAEPAKEADPLA